MLPYALFGIVVLLPLSWAPRWVNLAIGLTTTVVPVALLGGGVQLVPGLLVTGFALAQFGLPNALDRIGPHLLAVFVLAVAGSVPALLWQEQDPLGGDPARPVLRPPARPGNRAGAVEPVVAGPLPVWAAGMGLALRHLGEPRQPAPTGHPSAAGLTPQHRRRRFAIRSPFRPPWPSIEPARVV